MPVYEYQCQDCGTVFEKFQRFSDPPVDHCPHGHGHVHRLLSAPAIIFKGSGFYATDHGRNGGSRSSAKKTHEPKVDTPTSTATEDKPSRA